MTAFSKWRLVSIEELCLRVFNVAETCGEAHVYLHGDKWCIRGHACNDMADDHVMTVIPRVTKRREVEVKALRAMLAEVAT